MRLQSAARVRPGRAAEALRARFAGRRVVQLALTLRGLGLLAVEPLDYVARLLNGKRKLPPMHLRRYVGPLAGMEHSAGEFASYLKLLCGATSGSRVLDLGCGFGLMGLSLKDFIRPPGAYLGIDISRGAIRWAERRITPQASHFRFVHVDIQNDAYNRWGRLSAEDVVLPLSSDRFDIVLLKSVFTHMKPPAVRNYLAQIRNHLAEDGICLATLFLLTAGGRNGDPRRGRSIDFKFGDSEWRYAYQGVPELAVAYSGEVFADMVEHAGLAVQQIHPGTWSDIDNGLSYQDIALIRHANTRFSPTKDAVAPAGWSPGSGRQA